MAEEPKEVREVPETVDVVVVVEEKKRREFHFWNAFKNFAILFSFFVNFILVMVLLLSPGPLFMTKSQVVEPLLLDLDAAFAGLGETHIRQNIEIDDAIPVIFELQLKQNSVVTLTSDVPLSLPATFYLPGGGGQINGSVFLELPDGLPLPIALGLNVPVSETVPVVMSVPIDIPLDEAGMGPAIADLREVFRPLRTTVEGLPNSAQELIRPE